MNLCDNDQGNLGIVERDELGALFYPVCGSDSFLCVVAQDLFDRPIVVPVGSLSSACALGWRMREPPVGAREPAKFTSAKVGRYGAFGQSRGSQLPRSMPRQLRMSHPSRSP